MRNLCFLLVFALSFLLGINQLNAQSNPGFSKASPKMVRVLNTYIKSHPKQFRSYKFAKPSMSSVIDIWTLKKAYDLNPNDLSLKAGKYLDSTFLLVIPLSNDKAPGNRVNSDAMRLPKVQRNLNLVGLYPSRNIFAAFILKPDRLGNFEIQDL